WASTWSAASSISGAESYCSDTCCSISCPKMSTTTPPGRAGSDVVRAGEDLEGELAETEVQQRHDRDHHEDEREDDEEVGHQLLAGGVDHLAQLGDDLA